MTSGDDAAGGFSEAKVRSARRPPVEWIDAVSDLIMQSLGLRRESREEGPDQAQAGCA